MSSTSSGASTQQAKGRRWLRVAMITLAALVGALLVYRAKALEASEARFRERYD